MEQKIQELTEKLYQEGVVKGNEEAEKIIGEAQKNAKSIIEKAKQEAEALLNDAQKKASELDKNTRSELKLATIQLIASLQQEVSSMVSGKIVDESVKMVTDDKQFMQNLIQSAVEKWSEKQSPVVFVSPAEKKSIDNYFATKAKALLDSGLSIETANNIKAGFQIGPSDGSYKVSFTREDFISFFKEFIRPKVVELLFEDK